MTQYDTWLSNFEHRQVWALYNIVFWPILNNLCQAVKEIFQFLLPRVSLSFKYNLKKIIAICICTYTDMSNTLFVSQADKINLSCNFYIRWSHQIMRTQWRSVHFRTSLLIYQFKYLMVKLIFTFLCVCIREDLKNCFFILTRKCAYETLCPQPYACPERRFKSERSVTQTI